MKLNDIRAAVCRRVSKQSALYLGALLLISGLLHLAALSHPRYVVFDEVHFGKFVTGYCCSGEHIFDIHPPHAKLIIAGTARLLGYNERFDFDHIGEFYGAVSPVPMRFAPALAGALLPLVIFLLLRRLRASRPAALFGGLLIVFDNALLAHSRIISLDSILLLATFGALLLFLLARHESGRWLRFGLYFASGCLAGLAVGTKFTGAMIFGLIGLYVLVQLAREFGRAALFQWMRHSLAWFAGVVIVYGLGWYLHYALISAPGDGDQWQRPSGDFISDTLEIHRTMFEANKNLTATHHDSSPWWAWPIMQNPVFFWTGAAETGAAQPPRIYLLGNPLIWWGGSLLFVVLLVNLALARASALRLGDRPAEQRPVLWIPIVGFLMAYLPFVMVARALFMYHFYTPLIFALMAVVLWLDYAGWIRPEGLRGQRVSVYGCVALLLACFIFISPLTFGTQWGADWVQYLFQVFPAWL